MNRRIAAWLALLSMLAGIVLPAHVHARTFGADGPGDDFCATGQRAKALPALPESGQAAACDMCSGCAGAATAPPRASLVTPLPSPGAAPLREDANAPLAADVRAAAYPRGPPRALTCNERCAAIHAALRSVPRNRQASRSRTRKERESPCRPSSRSWGSSSH